MPILLNYGKQSSIILYIEKAEQGMPQLVRLKDAKKETWYWVEKIKSDWGRAFSFRKIGREPDVHHVLIDDSQNICDCQGFLRFGYCRHIQTSLELLKSRYLTCQACQGRGLVIVPHSGKSFICSACQGFGKREGGDG